MKISRSHEMPHTGEAHVGLAPRLRRTMGLVLQLAIAWLICRSTATAAPPAVADKPEAATTTRDAIGTDWVRVRYDDKHTPLAMETAIVRYVPANAKAADPTPTVDLVAAVHVGDAAYYEALNRRFDSYDALLYELVAPEGTVVEKGRGTSNTHPLGALQNGMKTMLALEHQLEKVDYTKKNFVHADMSPDQFLQAMKDRNEGFLQMYMKLLGHTLGAQSEMMANGESPDVAMFAALFADDRPLRLKRILAQQLADTEEMLTSFGGEEGSVLISDRNQAALKVLKKEIADGKQHLAIFYGAGHLTDMDKRLRTEFGLKPVEITWLTAWDLNPKK
ncbi:MAG: hypothetical protein AB7G28_11925 [Pirellulales bacterium]